MHVDDPAWGTAPFDRRLDEHISGWNAAGTARIYAVSRLVSRILGRVSLPARGINSPCARAQPGGTKTHNPSQARLRRIRPRRIVYEANPTAGRRRMRAGTSVARRRRSAEEDLGPTTRCPTMAATRT